MPELRHDEPARLMHFVGNAFPTGQCFGRMEIGNFVIHARRGMVNRCALGDYQTHPALGAAAIIISHILRRMAARRMAARHRCHNNTVGNFQTVQSKG